MAIGALAVVGGHLAPDFIGDLFRPMVPVAIPFPGAVAGQHFFKGNPAGRFIVCRLVQQEQRHGVAVAMAFVVQPGFQAGHTQVTATALGQGPAEIQLAVLAQVRQVFQDNLVLQGNGGGGNHQGFAQRLGHRDGGNQVRQGFTGTGTGLHHAGGRRRGALTIVVVDIAHVSGNLGNHQALAITGTDVLAGQQVAVGLLDLLLYVFCQGHYLGLTQSLTVPTRKYWPFLLSTTPSSVMRSMVSCSNRSPVRR